MTNNPRTYAEWETHCKKELAFLSPTLLQYGYTLDQQQPHLKGERFLMQAVTTASGEKFILLGRKNNERVVIKASKDRGGIAEITHEQLCRDTLKELPFAASVFHAPKPIEHIHAGSYVIAIHEFIEQETSFLERPLIEQFNLALRAFKAQEGVHATTHGHREKVRSVYGIKTAETYLKDFASFKDGIEDAGLKREHISIDLENASRLLTREKKTIEQYCGFLTHTDFVPHNIRIKGNTMYLLDHSSLTFGNKHEGWARFLNFMMLYNRPLEDALLSYVDQNRSREEVASLSLMRIYRLGEIIWYYVRTLSRSDDALLKLNTARIEFWHDVLTHQLNKVRIPDKRIFSYQNLRDSLRSAEEKERQINLH